MKYRKRNTYIARAILIVFLLVATSCIPETAKAANDITAETILKTYTGSVNGIERDLFLTKSKTDTVKAYIKIGEEGPYFMTSMLLDVGLDRYGTVWILDDENIIWWWNYELSPNLSPVTFISVSDPNSTDPDAYVDDVESLIYEGSGTKAIVVGYRTFSGEEYSLLSFEEIKALIDPDSSVTEPSYVPKGETPLPPTASPTIPNPESPSVETSAPPTVAPPTQTPSVSEPPTLATPIPSPLTSTQVPIISTDSPSVTVQPTATSEVSKKLSIEKSKKKGNTTYSLCEGNKTVIEYTLKKGKLTWKVGKKKGNAKGVKYAGFIKKSKNLFFMDKKGRGYTVSSQNGKKKLIIKKGAKKLVCSGKFVAKVKTASGSINISNK